LQFVPSASTLQYILKTDIQMCMQETVAAYNGIKIKHKGSDYI